MKNNADIKINYSQPIQRHIFICQCHSLEHQASFWYDDDENEIYIQVHLTTDKNFFKRLWSGLKYAFGHRSMFGDWDEFVFKNEDLSKLNEFVNKTKKDK